MSIPFTQFLMPDGRQKTVEIDRPEEVESLAQLLIDRGCRFEIEMLSTCEISMECVYGFGVALASELCPNGPQVPGHVDKMIRDAAAALPAADVLA